MPEYNITEVLPTSSSRQISALLTFNDAAMNAELARGVIIFQTLKDQWRLSAQYANGSNNTWIIYFRLYYSGTVQHSNVSEQQTNRVGSLKWSASLRNVSSGGLISNWIQNTANFTVGPPDIGVVGGFDFGYYPPSHRVIWTGSQYILSIELTITIPEIIAREEPQFSNVHFDTWRNTSFKFARLLLDSAGGDVVFVARDADNSLQKLYAYKSILAGNSEYFASRLSPEWRQRSASHSAETSTYRTRGMTSQRDFEAQDPSPSTSDHEQDGRQTIYLDDPANDIDFVTLHNILYYIYIGCVNLPLPKEEHIGDTLPEGFPEEPDPFSLFRNADKFLLPSLKERCLYNLQHGVTTENVAERLFHPDCQYHEELKEFYYKYLMAHYDEVKDTEGWERAVCSDEDVSASTAKYRARLFLKISRKETQ